MDPNQADSEAIVDFDEVFNDSMKEVGVTDEDLNAGGLVVIDSSKGDSGEPEPAQPNPESQDEGEPTAGEPADTERSDGDEEQDESALQEPGQPDAMSGTRDESWLNHEWAKDFTPDELKRLEPKLKSADRLINKKTEELAAFKKEIANAMGVLGERHPDFMSDWDLLLQGKELPVRQQHQPPRPQDPIQSHQQPALQGAPQIFDTETEEGRELQRNLDRYLEHQINQRFQSAMAPVQLRLNEFQQMQADNAFNNELLQIDQAIEKDNLIPRKELEADMMPLVKQGYSPTVAYNLALGQNMDKQRARWESDATKKVIAKTMKPKSHAKPSMASSKKKPENTNFVSTGYESLDFAKVFNETAEKLGIGFSE